MICSYYWLTPTRVWQETGQIVYRCKSEADWIDERKGEAEALCTVHAAKQWLWLLRAGRNLRPIGASMRTFSITADNNRFLLGSWEFELPVGEAVPLEEILDALNLQARIETQFLKFYAVAGEQVGYSFVNDATKVLRGRVEL